MMSDTKCETMRLTTNPINHMTNHMNNESRMSVWFILGPIGAGKSFFINMLLKTHKLTYLSPDILQRDRHISYIEARERMELIMRHHIDKSIPFITEGTGQYDDLRDLFVSYTKQNIDLKVFYIDVDLSVALKRNKNRTRVLDDSVVLWVHAQSTARRHLWKEFDCVYLDYKDLLLTSTEITDNAFG